MTTERTEVLALLRRQTRVLVGIVVILIAGGAGFTAQQDRIGDQADKLEHVTDANRQLVLGVRRSTFVGCVLIANAIQQSGANRSQQTQGPARRGSGQRRTPKPGQSPQSRLNTRLVAKILSLMTPRELRQVHRLQQEIAASGGGVVTVPDCGDVVMHPERVRPIQIKP